MDSAVPRADRPPATSESPSSRRRLTITVTSRSMWVAALIGLAILVVLFLIVKAQGPIVLLVLSIILGEAIRPLVVRLKRYHIPGPVAVLLIYLVALVIAGVLLWLLLTPLFGEVSALVSHLPQYLTQLQADIHALEKSLRATGSVGATLDGLSASLATFLQNSIPALLAVPFNALTGLFALFINLVIVLTMTLFWLMSSVTLKTFVVGLFPLPSQEHVAEVITEVGKSFGGYVRGTLISMFIIGSISGLGLTFLGVPYALLLGLLAGLTELLPYIGPWISGTVAVVVALVAVDPTKAIEVIVLFVLIQEIEGNVVEPLVMSRSVHIDPLLVIVSVLIGIELLGIIGAILAVPIAAGIQVVVVRVLAPMLRRASGQPAQAEHTPPTVAASPAAPAPASASAPVSVSESSSSEPPLASEHAPAT